MLTGGGSSITSAALNINPLEQIEKEREEQEMKVKIDISKDIYLSNQ